MRSPPGIEMSRRLYQWATPAEQQLLLTKLTSDRSTQHSKYKARFVAAANAIRPDYLQFSNTEYGEDSLHLPKVFHQGLLKDDQNIFWIVKKFNPGASEVQLPR